MIHKTTLAVLAAVLIFFLPAASRIRHIPKQAQSRRTRKVRALSDRDGINLTADQKAQLKSIHQSTREQLLALRNDQTLSPEQRQAKARSIKEGVHQQMRGILTPQQQEFVKNNRRERHERGPGAVLALAWVASSVRAIVATKRLT